MQNQVEYDSQTNMGYLYLVPLSLVNVNKTEELDINTDLVLDFDKDERIVGIEFQGKTAKKLSNWTGKQGIFNESVDKFGNKILSFRLKANDGDEKVFLKGTEIAFVFSDISYRNFLGIDILDTSRYSKKYLTDDET